MSRQAESKLSKTIIDALNARGHFAYKNHGSIFMPAGLPDIGGHCRDGRSLYLETKMPGEEVSGLSAEQYKFMRRLVRSCPLVVVSVVSSVEQAIRACEGGELYAQVQSDCVRMVHRSELTDAEYAAVTAR